MPQDVDRNTVERVKAEVMRRERSRAYRSNFGVMEAVFTRGEPLPVPRQRVAAERPTVVAFADDAPLFNWGHPCRYLLHDPETGALYRQVDAQFPPFSRERDMPAAFRLFHEAVRHPEAAYYPAIKDLVLRPRAKGRRFAVLFSGMSNNRHTNDLEFLYRTLRDVYGFAAGNITVLNHDGTLNYDGNPQPPTSWPGDSSSYRMPVDGQGSSSDLLAALDDLKSRLKPDDFLLIHTNNHGGHNGTESDLCCFPNWDGLGVADFTDKLAELPPFRCLMVMMEQCHSGGFNTEVINKSTAGRTSIASACIEPNNSIGGAHFDPFARDWIAAMAGNDPYGNALSSDPDTTGNGRITAREAFDYADLIHDHYDTPVFDEAGGGGGCWLGQALLRIPIPILVARNFYRFWPEPDPLVIERRVEAVLPQIEELDREFAPRLTEVAEEYTKRLEQIIRKAAR